MEKVRIATPGDIPMIQAIAQTTWPVAFKDILSQNQIDYMLARMYGSDVLSELIGTKQNIFLLALDAMLQPVGFAAYELNYRGGKQTKIHKLYVLPSAQGLGSGTELCAEVGRQAMKVGNDKLTLNVNKYNHTAISFYEKAGFQTVKEETIPIGEGYLMEDFVMEKHLL
ncbi:GNAT family N-acetyltransferase [Lunatimonas salinarum]|uniref:GNAT family N-acetyltransferase n=1 Tax=Lunatimonas salinarum TaxID=1774590 RepID=UPI001AE0AE03|nr:GNAT family N-acetyltransferase [Lunatimonas salinarum]